MFTNIQHGSRSRRSAGQRSRAVLEALEARQLLSLLADASGFAPLTFPKMSYTGAAGAFTYSSTTGALDFTAVPTGLLFLDSSTIVTVTNPTLQVHVLLNSNGTLASGSPGFTLTGSVTMPNNITYIGTLLTGTATGFGFDFGGFNADNFDFTFNNIQGQLASNFNFGSGIYILVNSEAEYLAGGVTQFDASNYGPAGTPGFINTTFSALPKGAIATIPVSGNTPPNINTTPGPTVVLNSGAKLT